MYIQVDFHTGPEQRDNANIVFSHYSGICAITLYIVAQCIHEIITMS